MENNKTIYRVIFLVVSSCYSLVSFSQTAEIPIGNFNESIRLYNESREWLDQRTNLNLVIKNCRKAIKLNPTNSDFFYAIASAYSFQNKLDSAQSNILRAIALDDKQSDYYDFAGNVFFKSKNYTEAIENYSLAIQWNELSEVKLNVALCYYNRGVSYLNLKQFENAKSDFSSCINLGGMVVGAYHNRGIVNLKLKRAKDACNDFNKAVDLGSRISQKYIDKYCN